jgi:hypothetical protein
MFSNFVEIESIIDISLAFPNDLSILGAIQDLYKSCFTGQFVEEDCIKYIINGDFVRKIIGGLSSGKDATLSRYLYNYISFARTSEIESKSEVAMQRLKDNTMWNKFWKMMDKHVSRLKTKEKKTPTAHFDNEIYRGLISLLQEGKGDDRFKCAKRSEFTPSLIYTEFLWIHPHHATYPPRRLCQLLDRSSDFLFSRSQAAFDEVATFFSQYPIDTNNIQYELIILGEIFQKFNVCLFFSFSF